MTTRARQIVVDTETTGLEVEQGHRIIEIGCVEMRNRRVSGETFQRYLNPQRDIDEAAIEIHGITAEQLRAKPTFAEIAGELLEFLKDAELILHNAPFDVGFLNYEFANAGLGDSVIETHCTVTDTLAMARQKHPGQRNTLDALCKRYNVDNSRRDFHGALLDAEILADVYLAMTGGQITLINDAPTAAPPAPRAMMESGDSQPANTVVIAADEDELKLHEKWLQLLDQECEHGAVWRRAGGSAPPIELVNLRS